MHQSIIADTIRRIQMLQHNIKLAEFTCVYTLFGSKFSRGIRTGSQGL